MSGPFVARAERPPEWPAARGAVYRNDRRECIDRYIEGERTAG